VPATGDDSRNRQPEPVAGPLDQVMPLVQRFQEFAETWRSRAPLYASIATTVSLDPDLAALLLRAPAPQQLPVLLFAAVHDLVLADPSAELARWYPNLGDAPRSPGERRLARIFRAFVRDHEDEISDRLRTRSTQTNEVGRCALLLPAFGLLAKEVGPLAHLDVGASGGLNLLIDRYEYRYTGRDGATKVVGSSPVVIPITTRGDVPVPDRMPTVSRRCGVDRQPIDVTDPDEARWLEACVWPDHVERFDRLAAAIHVAREDPPELLAGDAVTSLAPAVERLGSDAHPVVTNSWVLNYLTADQRTDYLAELDRIGAERDLSWVYAEAPVHIPELPNSPDPSNPHLTVLSMVRWRDGTRTVDHLATCHPHGRSMYWR
jgi:hypothetical protein